jgi:hypothetical protein
METWATFSITDHRKPIYRQALALFDRIVVPLPKEPIGDQTQDELDQLSAELEYLYKADAAVARPFDSESFQAWRLDVLAEATAAGINNDKFLDTRLMLAQQTHVPDVQAIPVYGSHKSFADNCRTLMQAEEALTIEITQKLPVPDRDTSLQSLIDLRRSPQFRKALDDLLEWKRDKAPAIVLAEDKEAAIKAALRDFDKMTKAYADAMQSHGFKKFETVASIFFSLVTLEPLGALKETLVGFREMKEPCWKKLSDAKCAPGGVVYHFKEAIRTYT